MLPLLPARSSPAHFFIETNGRRKKIVDVPLSPLPRLLKNSRIERKSPPTGGLLLLPSRKNTRNQKKRTTRRNQAPRAVKPSRGSRDAPCRNARFPPVRHSIRSQWNRPASRFSQFRGLFRCPSSGRPGFPPRHSSGGCLLPSRFQAYVPSPCSPPSVEFRFPAFPPRRASVSV